MAVFSHHPIRIAVLDCGRFPDPIRQRCGGYRELYENVLVQAAQQARAYQSGTLPDDAPATAIKDLQVPQFVVSGFDVESGTTYPDLDDVDVIMVSGSKHNAYDSDPWIIRLLEYIQSVLAQDRVRLVGICFGHQIIARALGADVGLNERGWEVAVTQVQMTPEGKKLFGVDELALQQFHRDIVGRSPIGVTPLGSTPLCANQGMYSPKVLLTLQGHPEFSGQTTSELLDIRMNYGVLEESVYREAKGRANLPHDGILAGVGIWRFILED